MADCRRPDGQGEKTTHGSGPCHLTPSSMPCVGKDGDGCSKSCTTFKAKKPGEVTEKSRCQCSHRKKVHTTNPTVQNMMARYALDKLRTQPTDKEARAESSAGFRPASSAMREGELRDKGCPMGAKVEQARKRQLAVFKTRDNEELLYDATWEQARIDKWLHQLMPMVFEFLDTRYPEEGVASAYHWLLLGKEQRRLYVMDRDTITASDLTEAVGSTKRPPHEHVLRIGESCFTSTKHKLTSTVCNDLEGAIDRLHEKKSVHSESEVEEVVKPARRRSLSRKVKMEETSSEDSDDSENENKLDRDKADSDFPEMVSNQPRTSLPAARVKQEPEEINDLLDDSDVEEIPRPDSALLDPFGLERKRSVSPFGSFDPDSSHKRMRSKAGISRRRSPASSDEETRGSMTPRLRPTTSSFQANPTASTLSTWIPPTGVLGAPFLSAPQPVAGIGSDFASRFNNLSAPASTSHASITPGASSSSLLVQSRRLTGHTVKKWVPPPPREGLSVPKAGNNPWST
ncbi:hypothetical protein B0H16DRAFT_1840655 [Mycena metata]|uniref:Uncharacterized protein n=1 Tax=Mycena metata TaxID=1033252 RepID=A0AAD7IVL3_9AGAR|nr:hypothetical protein B0H16DRAFT_1840655 [Mycena metata]